MKRLLAFLLALCMAMMLCLTGCGAPANQDASSAPAGSASGSSGGQQETEDQAQSTGSTIEGKTIAVNVPSLSYEFFAKIGKDLEALGKELGFNVVVDSCDFDQSKQSDQLMNYTSMDIDYVAVVPVETTGCLNAMAALKAEGIVVINLLGSLAGYEDSYNYSIVQNEFEVGTGAAELAAEWIDATFPDAEDGSIGVAIFEKNTSSDAISRSEGLYEVEKLTSKAKVVVNYDFGNITDTEVKAQEYADMMFVDNPEVKVVLTYQADMATAVDEIALRQNIQNPDQFAIFSVDWTERLGTKLASSPDGESYIRGTSACWVNLASNIVALINGELEVDENNEYGSGSWKVTPENLDEYLEITAS